MKLILASTVTALGLLVGGSAIAQTAPPMVNTTGSITLTPDQRLKVKEYIVKERRPAMAVPSGFTISTGAVVPEAVELYALGPDVGMSQYRYTMFGNRAVLVDPTTRRIIQVIE